MSEVIIVSGEASGDYLGALLTEELRHRRPQTAIFGVGQNKMRLSGAAIVADSAPLAVMGYWDVVAKLPSITALTFTIRREIRRRRPQLYVGIDAPDFNLPMARYARTLGIKTVQYVSPSVWMWRKERIKTIRRAVDAVWCLLPFEKKIYDSAGLSAVFVGHPEASATPLVKSATRQILNINGNEKVAALMPGSRAAELRMHLPLFARIMQLLAAEDLVFMAAATDEQAAKQIQNALPGAVVRVGMAREVLAAADVALVKSGTVALQSALAGTPYVAVYQASAMASWLAMRRQFYLPFATLPNILCGRFVAPELLLAEAQPEMAAKQMRRLLSDANSRDKQISAFADLRDKLTGTQSPADAALQMLQ